MGGVLEGSGAGGEGCRMGVVWRAGGVQEGRGAGGEVQEERGAGREWWRGAGGEGASPKHFLSIL